MPLLSIQVAQPASSHLDKVVGDNTLPLPNPTTSTFANTMSAIQSVPSVPVGVEAEVKTETDPESIPPPPKTISERAAAAAAVLNRYRIGYKNDWDIPSSISYAETQIQQALERDEPIQLVLPAFPFKSSNRSKKVLGRFPDEAERLSLLHLNGLCLGIKDVADADAYLTVVSDGIVYNDILGVSDEDVWDYGQSLREMAAANGCRNIRFTRICDLLGPLSGTVTLDKETYLEKAAHYRELIQANVPEGFDVVDAIANDVNTNKTYTGYKKFLMSEREERPGRSRSQMERENAAIAKQMVTRGKAFADIIKQSFSDSVRLSIHPSDDTNKISIKLLPQSNEIVMTPWHGAVVRSADGSVSMTHALSVPAMSHELIYTTVSQDGKTEKRPSYFRERSDVFDWPGMDLTFEYLYPCGVVIRPASADLRYSLSMADMQKVRRLAETCSPVVLRGFANTRDKDTYVSKAHELGEIFMWKSLITVVKDDSSPSSSSGDKNGSGSRKRKNVAFTCEAMPMHYDGIFKVVTQRDERTGVEKKVSDPPRMQYFVSQSAAQPGDGYTLFASSDLFVRHLPRAYPIEKLERLRWTCDSYGHYHQFLEDIPLVVRHPTRGTPCIRWHQPWPKWRSPFHHARISIDNGSQKIIPLIDSLLFDRRVCLRFSWEEGDILVSDNVAMLHTRTSFNTAHPRELWRIHTY
ncbi:Clavaminate synthase-like protein [Xylariaceae sp. FL0594]|nr:Clavaminate synthase-like protein [Xylariaceae sp. FL0594]